MAIKYPRAVVVENHVNAPSNRWSVVLEAQEGWKRTEVYVRGFSEHRDLADQLARQLNEMIHANS